MANLTILDLFAGCGGFSNGFEQAGFEIVAAVELNKDAALTYEANHPNTQLYLQDIHELDGAQILKDVGEIDGIIGGPPCQGFSVAGKRDIADQRNTLPLEFIRLVQAIRPKFFVMENVSGLLNLDKGRIFEYILSKLSELGYEVTYQLLKTIDYGVPQLRERVIVVGFLKSLGIPFTYPEPFNTSPKTIADAIGDIEQIGDFDTVHLHNHAYAVPIDTHLYSKLAEGKFLCDVRHGKDNVHSWEIALKGECTEVETILLNAISENRRKKKYGDKLANPLSISDLFELTQIPEDLIQTSLDHLVDMQYLVRVEDKYDCHDTRILLGMRRFSRNGPINTISTVSATNGTYVHYSQARGFTVREVARLQTFPDTFTFKGAVSSQYKQVGNAVPPQLGKVIAEQIIKYLKEHEVI